MIKIEIRKHFNRRMYFGYPVDPKYVCSFMIRGSLSPFYYASLQFKEVYDWCLINLDPESHIIEDTDARSTKFIHFTNIDESVKFFMAFT